LLFIQYSERPPPLLLIEVFIDILINQYSLFSDYLVWSIQRKWLLFYSILMTIDIIRWYSLWPVTLHWYSLLTDYSDDWPFDIWPWLFIVIVQSQSLWLFLLFIIHCRYWRPRDLPRWLIWLFLPGGVLFYSIPSFIDIWYIHYSIDTFILWKFIIRYLVAGGGDDRSVIQPWPQYSVLLLTDDDHWPIFIVKWLMILTIPVGWPARYIIPGIDRGYSVFCYSIIIILTIIVCVDILFSIPNLEIILFGVYYSLFYSLFSDVVIRWLMTLTSHYIVHYSVLRREKWLWLFREWRYNDVYWNQ